jgi:diguanylate cyclase (GGDEF)-like protein
MLFPSKPANETARLASLRALNILDTVPEERFDRLTRLAKRLFGVPIAIVSLVDENRQWFKSCVGVDVRETARDISFCAHAILHDDVLLIPNALADERFHDNPLVAGDPGIRFYAGYPLTMGEGNKLGTLCLIDMKPRELQDEDLDLLRDLAHMAEQELAAIQLATMDELTQLSNRRGFEALGQHALSVCKRLERHASLLFFDLDGFKQINDKFGHAEGDRALQTFAAVLRETLRESDVIGRLGGDEFVALLTDTSGTQAADVPARVSAMLRAHNTACEHGYAIRFSVGQTDYDPHQHQTIADLLAASDSKMYTHKSAQRSGSADGN